EILVDGVDARDGASGEVLENWVWRQAFEVEYALRAGCSRIDQQLQLGVHGVDDPVPLLEPCKAPAQLAPDTLLLQECVEGDQASDTGQRAIVGPLPQAPRVRPADALLLFLPLVPRRPLASEPSSAHLLGARGAWYLLSHQPRRTGDSGAKFPLFAQFLTSQRLAPPTRWSEIQAQSVSGVKEIVLDLLGRDTEEGGELGDLRHHAIDGFLAPFGIAGARRNGPCRHRGGPCRIRRGCKRRAGRIRPRRAGSGWGERRSGPWRQSVPQHPPMQIGPMEVDNRSRFGCTVVLLGKGDAQWRLQFYCPSRSW